MKDYSPEVQQLFLEIMMQDAQSFLRVQNIFNSENFDRHLKETAQFIYDHANDHRTLPDRRQIEAVTGVKLQEIPELNEGHLDWCLQEFEGFTRRRELERAILKSADLLEKGTYDPVEKLIKDAVQISLTKDLGTDYFEDPRGRLSALKDNNGQNSTGWPALDKMLYGGFNRGELQIFAGGSGSGKSLFMANLGVNWCLQGMNVMYLTFELSENLVGMRLDAMISEIPSRDIFKQIDDVQMKVRMIGKKAGAFQVKYMPTGKNANDIRAYLKEYEIKTGLKVDALLIDYLDLMHPIGTKISAENLFVKDKYVSEELRNLAMELNCIFVTASQLNRSSVEEIEFDHSHISGGISKINTADNLIGIFTSRAMRERGRYQIQLMKTRSSSGVGSKIDLGFDVDTLRIIDLGEDDDNSYQSAGAGGSSSVLDSIKRSSAQQNSEPREDPSEGETVGKIRAQTDSTKLRDFLNNLDGE